MWISYVFTISLLLFGNGSVHGSGSLETVNDDDLLNLIRTENYVTVLFTKKDCELCDKYEDVLYQAREDIVDSLGAWVVKAINSQLVRVYNPAKEPTIVFFRHGVPMIYDGALNDELLLHTLIDNKEPCVRELQDENFEHLTQVATGATTGHWLILFYSTDCIECQNLQARWETVCSKLKRSMNVARINRQTVGRVTGRRFAITKTPTFVFFRLGKMYRYNGQKHEIDTLHHFAIEGYKTARLEVVPVPKSPLDDFILGILDFLQEFPFVFKIISTIIGVIIIITVAYKASNRKNKKNTQKSSKSKNK